MHSATSVNSAFRMVNSRLMDGLLEKLISVRSCGVARYDVCSTFLSLFYLTIITKMAINLM